MVVEIWKDVIGYEGLYQVSNMGRVRSLNRIDNGCKLRGKILTPYTNKGNYLRVRLSKDGEHKQFLVHRLVAETFIPNPNNLPCVNHIDEDKSNNTLSNLEWCTVAYNNSYGTRQERRIETIKSRKDLKDENNEMYGKHNSQESNKSKDVLKGENHPIAVKIYCFELDREFPSIKQCAKELGLWSGNISQCCNGGRKTTGGYHFYYVEDILYMN